MNPISKLIAVVAIFVGWLIVMHFLPEPAKSQGYYADYGVRRRQ